MKAARHFAISESTVRTFKTSYLRERKQKAGDEEMIIEELPFQLIYGGKAMRCHPPVTFPTDWDITHNEKHWSNEITMIRYIENVIVPFVESVREELGEEEKPALAIFDHFKGQLTESITALLDQYNIHSVIVPPNCTDKLQPLDLTVNKAAKSFLQSEFRDWYATEVAKQLTNGNTGTVSPVDLSTSRMKCIGVSWLIHLYEYLESNPLLLVNGFHAAGIPQSIDAGHLTTGNTLVEDPNDDTEDGNYTDEEDDGEYREREIIMLLSSLYYL